MTQTIGCVGGTNEDGGFKKLSDSEIVDKFNDFIRMFPTEDLNVLYDKTGGELIGEGGLTEDMSSESGDKGTWVISSYLDTDEDGTIGVLLRFDRNTRKAQGNFILRKGEDEEKYPIYYEDNKIHLVNEEIPTGDKEKFESFKMMYEFIELDRTYLDNLESTKIMYNPNAPIFDAHYKLEADDKNIKNIKEEYPNLIIDQNNTNLELHGSGKPWRKIGRVGMKIVLDKERSAYFSSYMSFDNSLEVEFA
ncbi:MAG: Csa1 family protein [Sarcina sp.]